MDQNAERYITKLFKSIIFDTEVLYTEFFVLIKLIIMDYTLLFDVLQLTA